MPKVSYIITLKNETEQAKAKKKTTASTATTDELGRARKSDEIKPIALYSYAKKVVNSAVEFQVNTVELRTGSSRLQERTQLAYSVANTGFGIIENALIGGLAFGGVGAVAGVAFGVVNTAINWTQNAARLNMSNTLEQVSISQQNIRSGTYGNRRR